jgi:putative endonuclease
LEIASLGSALLAMVQTCARMSLRGAQRRGNLNRSMSAMRSYWVYIMTNISHTVLYTGVTNNLCNRAVQHKARTGSQFTSRYRVSKLVFREEFGRITDAIAAEKRIKAGSRAAKIRLIESLNPEWKDLSAE